MTKRLYFQVTWPLLDPQKWEKDAITDGFKDLRDVYRCAITARGKKKQVSVKEENRRKDNKGVERFPLSKVSENEKRNWYSLSQIIWKISKPENRPLRHYKGTTNDPTKRSTASSVESNRKRKHWTSGVGGLVEECERDGCSLSFALSPLRLLKSLLDSRF